MTGTPPIPPVLRRPVVTAAPGRLSRWKQSEPARLYGYTVLVALSVVLVATGLVTQDLGHALTGLAAAVLGLVPAVESIRASVYSPQGHLEARLVDAGASAEAVRASIREGLL